MTSASPQPTDPVAAEIAVEQAHVDRVYAQLKHAQRSAEQAQAEGRSLYAYERGDYAREEDSTALFERDAFTFQAARRLAILDSEHEGLVFGRLDLSEDPDARYIGRIGVRDDDYEPLVIDWRAPAAEPFYRATPAAPMGVARRRVLRCRQEKVVGIEDDLLDGSSERNLPIVGEGALMAALQRARGPQMRDIVATIQGEQDEAIRAPYNGVTIISGGPGTGKTVVALHRAAYLLYSNRRRFEHGGVLVVGPSDVFMNYIDRVLPSLGEDSVTLRALGSVASDVVGLHAEAVDEPVAAEAKGSLVMTKVLRRLVLDPLSPDLELRVVVKGEVLTLPASRLRRLRGDALSGQQANRALPAARQGVLNALWELMPDDVDIERPEFDDIVTEQAAFTMFQHAWWPTLRPATVLPRLADADVAQRVCAGLLTPEQIEAVSASYTAGSEWTVADMALLDELYAIVGPEPPEPDEPDPTAFLEEGSGVAELVSTQDRLARTREVDPDDDGVDTFAHVLVDEAQDITPLQWRMLRRRGPQASWTIVGDPAQSSWPDPNETERALTDLIGHAPSRRFRLSTNYRSPAEVFELASRFIRVHEPDADTPHAVRSTGVEPLLLSVSAEALPTAMVEQVIRLGGEVEGTIGVVAPQHRLDDLQHTLQDQAADNPALAALAGRVIVVSPLQAKGLEYDAVVVVTPDDIVAQTSGGARTLYVALTRPTQRLVTLDVTDAGQPGEWRRALNQG